jgi:imidazolonepropionase-like amidohydrolase
MRKLLIALLALPFSVPAADHPYVLKAAHMFDGKGDHVVSPGLVVVSNGRILGVGPSAAIPAGAETIDLGDATLLPGLMDAHTHLSMPYYKDYRQGEMDPLKKTVAERTLDAVEIVRVTLMAGFTTVRDVGSSDYIDVGLRNAIREGKIPGPRMLVSVHALGSTGGHCDPTAGFAPLLFPEPGLTNGVINSADQAREAVRFNIKNGADVIKTCATGGVLSLTDDVDTPQLTQAELDALVDEAHALRRKTAAHAHGAAGAKRAVRAGIDSIEHGTFLDDEALEMMKAKGTYYLPTLMANQGLREMLANGGYLPPPVEKKARLAMESLNATVKKAIALGIKIGIGTDAGVYPHGRNAEEFHQLVDLGMKPVDALKAGTSVNANLLGVADRTGTLETGKLADVVACPGNPEENIRQVERVFFVMKDGAVYRNSKN